MLFQTNTRQLIEAKNIREKKRLKRRQHRIGKFLYEYLKKKEKKMSVFIEKRKNSRNDEKISILMF